MCKSDAAVKSYEAIKPLEFETLICVKHTWRSVAKPNRDNHIVEIEFLNEVTLELLRVNFFDVRQFQMENNCCHFFPVVVQEHKQPEVGGS